MHAVYAIASNVTTALGHSVEEVWNAISEGRRGVVQHRNTELSSQPFWASRLSRESWEHISETIGAKSDGLSSFETLALYSLSKALEAVAGQDLNETALVLATTKGNIQWLNTHPADRVALHSSGNILAKLIGISAKPIIVSHACVSGVTALQYGSALLSSGRYKNALVVGADKFTRFVLSGFQSFQAIADGPCKPFDAARTGINLGEGAATIILSTDAGKQPLARLCGGATTNDANHISGPSRTGAELSLAITRAIAEAGITPEDIGAISAHGTATLYNDEMEAKAFAHAGVIHAPLHSLKGYLGHTLGCAGILESAMIIESLRKGCLIPSAGFDTLGVSEAVNVTTSMQPAPLKYALKTASGFGGCNAAIVWQKL